jgi:RNA-directed DNA polymerase
LLPRNAQRLLHDRQAGRARARFSLVAPLASITATDRRTTDMADHQLDLFSVAQVPSTSGAAAPVRIGQGGVDSANGGILASSAPATPTTPGTRTSATAIRTTTTRATTTVAVPSAKGSEGLFSTGVEHVSMGELIAAWLDCRRTKRGTAAARAFELDLEANLAELLEALNDGSYQPGPSICFVVTRPKDREVWAAGFADRVVHHLLHRAIGARFERGFIADSCASIKHRGTLYAARRLERKVRAITANWQRPAFYLKCDLQNFFPTIDKPRLVGLLERKVPEPFWRDLAARVLLHDPRPGVDLRGDARRLARIPPAKSLFNQPAHRGLPIGNYTSQFGANVYLDELDQFVKHRLGVRHYIRYVDDFILLQDSPQQLNAWRTEIQAWLSERLDAKLHPAKTVLQPIARGIDFVGHVLKPHRRTLRRRTLNDALHRLARTERAELAAAATSYLGLARQTTSSHRDRCRIANLVRRRGLAVDHQLTKAYP